MRVAGTRQVLCGLKNKVPLNNNKSGSLGRLKLLLRWLEQNPKTFKAYDQIIRDRLVNNLIEK